MPTNSSPQQEAAADIRASGDLSGRARADVLAKATDKARGTRS
jgi:hypothetical protein